MADIPIVSGRQCGPCTMCCRVPPIKDLGKPHDVCCVDLDLDRGCRIYGSRPAVCRGFFCDYLVQPMVGEHWYPALSKMILFSEPGGERLAIYVDASAPDAWREQPYYGEIKQWATWAARAMRQVLVYVGGRSIAILPDEDVDLGEVGEDEQIVMADVLENGRRRLRVTKRAAEPGR